MAVVSKAALPSNFVEHPLHGTASSGMRMTKKCRGKGVVCLVH